MGATAGGSVVTSYNNKGQPSLNPFRLIGVDTSLAFFTGVSGPKITNIKLTNPFSAAATSHRGGPDLQLELNKTFGTLRCTVCCLSFKERRRRRQNDAQGEFHENHALSIQNSCK
jgi:hypothetical protein